MCAIYPIELETKETIESSTSASYQDMLPLISDNCYVKTSVYDKHNGFNFTIKNFPFVYRNIPSSPAYGVSISNAIPYARAC